MKRAEGSHNYKKNELRFWKERIKDGSKCKIISNASKIASNLVLLIKLWVLKGQLTLMGISLNT